MAASFVKIVTVKAILYLVAKMSTYPHFHLSPDKGKNRHTACTNNAVELLTVS
jgi:hypothetical protein